MKRRQEKLFEELDLSGLESWPPKLADSAQSLLPEYHNVFSLELSKLGCTHSTKHVIKVTNYTQFKEWFRQIPLPLVEEVHTHLQEMLHSVAFVTQPECMVQCSGVGLKEGWRPAVFVWITTNSTPTWRKTPTHCWGFRKHWRGLVHARHFSCLDLKSGFWQIKMDESSKQYTTFSVGTLGFFKCNSMAFGLCNAPATFQVADAKLPWGTKSDILPYPPWWYSHVFSQTSWRTSSSLTHHLWLIKRA